MITIWLSLSAVLAEVVFVTEVSRHGARSPTTYFDWDNDGRWVQGPGELTPLGMRQHYLIGYELRNRYILQTPLLSSNFSTEEIYVRSTDYNRTLQSAYSQLQGLYPDGTGPSLHELSLQSTAVPPIHVYNLSSIEQSLGTSALPSFLQALPVHTDSNSRNLLLLPEDNCSYAKSIMNSNVNDQTKASYYAQYPYVIQTIQNYFGVDYQTAVKKFEGLYDSITANAFSGFSFPYQFNSTTFRNQSQELHGKLFSLTFGKPDIVAQMLASDFMTLLRDALTQASNNSTSLKFLFLSAHDSTLQGYINGMQLNTTSFPYYASTLITELHLTKGQYFVRMLFNDVPVVVPDCTEAMCPLNTFLGYLNNRLIPNIQQYCNMTHSTGNSATTYTTHIVVASFSISFLSAYAFAMLLSRRKRGDLPLQQV
mmetsp:Transcript_1180/g.2853  ORF Transcript_1180/g.2853 Transcript_1180/m.2853 type:complete len:424 (-) Transcript_1180:2542-3813(-)